MPKDSFAVRKLLRFVVMCCLPVAIVWALPETTSAQSSKTLRKIVLDAGHGGRDIGTPKRRYSKHEKDLALDVVLKLGKLLEKNMPDVEVVYTRKTDVFVELKKRHEIANRANADLFISVHVNATAARTTQASGTETYVLGLHRNGQKGKAIEDYSDKVMEEPGLLDENDPTTKIIIAQYTQAFLAQSINIAVKVQDNFVKIGRHNYGVKQKGLEVLAGSAMPGILIEIGFINNPSDEAYMNSESGQQATAAAIYNAIRSYRDDLYKGRVRP